MKERLLVHQNMHLSISFATHMHVMMSILAACNSVNIPTDFCGTSSSSNKLCSHGHRQRNLGPYPSAAHSFHRRHYASVPSIRTCRCCIKIVVRLHQRNGTSICNSSGSHQHCFICAQPNQQETHMRFDVFSRSTCTYPLQSSSSSHSSAQSNNVASM